jgi:hypothetical protein
LRTAGALFVFPATSPWYAVPVLGSMPIGLFEIYLSVAIR